MSALLASLPLARLRGWAASAAGGLAQAAGASAAPIGLELSPERLNMVQFDRAAGAPTIRAAVSLPYAGGRQRLLDDPAGLQALVRQALRSRPFRGRRVVSCLPAADIRTVMVSYQAAAGQDDAAAIVRELRERLKTELDGAVVDYLPIRNDDSPSAERSAIVAVAEREQVVAYLEALRRAGLEAMALDIGPAALARLVAALDRTRSHANALLLNFGHARSYISLIWGRRLMLDREVDFGEARLVQRLATVLSMAEPEALRLLHEHGVDASGDGGRAASPAIARTVAEVLRPAFGALAQEINKTLIYTASRTRGRSVDCIHLLGSAARYPGIAALLQRLVSIPVEVIDPLRAFGMRPGACAEGELGPIAGIGVATGLALRGQGGDG